MRYSRRASHYLERITLSNLTYIMSVIDPITISVEALRYYGHTLKKDFTKLVRINP